MQGDLFSPQITSFHNNDFFNNAVIEPPKEYLYFDNNKKYTRIVIDSKDRNTNLFPNPNEYEIVLDDDINDVVSAQLISADVPFSSYLINELFKNLYVTVSSTEYIVPLTTGDYSPLSLAAHIESQLNTVISNDFRVSYDTTKDNFVFTSKIPFTLSFNGVQNPLNMLLGFDKISYTSDVNNALTPYENVIQSPFRRNFSYNKYVYLVIEQFDLNKGNAKPINKSFAALTQEYNILSINDTPKIIKYFSPIIPRLSKIKIAFYDRFGNKYDFQNIDNRLEFLFISFKQRSKYQTIFGQPSPQT